MQFLHMLHGQERNYVAWRLVLPAVKDPDAHSSRDPAVPLKLRGLQADQILELVAQGFDKNSQVPMQLRLRVGAQVMCLRNLDQSPGQSIMNGSRGVVQSFDSPEVAYSRRVRKLAELMRSIMALSPTKISEEEVANMPTIVAKVQQLRDFVHQLSIPSSVPTDGSGNPLPFEVKRSTAVVAASSSSAAGNSSEGAAGAGDLAEGAAGAVNSSSSSKGAADEGSELEGQMGQLAINNSKRTIRPRYQRGKFAPFNPHADSNDVMVKAVMQLMHAAANPPAPAAASSSAAAALSSAAAAAAPARMAAAPFSSQASSSLPASPVLLQQPASQVSVASSTGSVSNSIGSPGSGGGAAASGRLPIASESSSSLPSSPARSLHSSSSSIIASSSAAASTSVNASWGAVGAAASNGAVPRVNVFLSGRLNDFYVEKGEKDPHNLDTSGVFACSNSSSSSSSASACGGAPPKFRPVPPELDDAVINGQEYRDVDRRPEGAGPDPRLRGTKFLRWAEVVYVPPPMPKSKDSDGDDEEGMSENAAAPAAAASSSSSSAAAAAAPIHGPFLDDSIEIIEGWPDDDVTIDLTASSQDPDGAAAAFEAANGAGAGSSSSSSAHQGPAAAGIPVEALDDPEDAAAAAAGGDVTDEGSFDIDLTGPDSADSFGDLEQALTGVLGRPAVSLTSAPTSASNRGGAATSSNNSSVIINDRTSDYIQELGAIAAADAPDPSDSQDADRPSESNGLADSADYALTGLPNVATIKWMTDPETGEPITYPTVKFANGREEFLVPEEFTQETPGIGAHVVIQVPLKLAWCLSSELGDSMMIEVQLD